MANVKSHVTIGAPASLDCQRHKVVWDFSVDGGATGALNLFTADGECLVTEFHMYVETAAETSATGTLSVGPTGATTKFTNAAAAATLASGYTVAADAIGDLPHRLTDGQSIIQTIGGDADPGMDGGKIHYTIGVMKATI